MIPVVIVDGEECVLHGAPVGTASTYCGRPINDRASLRDLLSASRPCATCFSDWNGTFDAEPDPDPAF